MSETFTKGQYLAPSGRPLDPGNEADRAYLRDVLTREQARLRDLGPAATSFEWRVVEDGYTWLDPQPYPLGLAITED